MKHKTPESEIETKLFETTQYLITIARRCMEPGPFGLDKEIYFISENVKDALENIGTEQAKFFVEEIKRAKLKDRRFTGRPADIRIYPNK